MKTASLPRPVVTPAKETRHACRRHDTWSPGDCAHQGDLILVCLDQLPAGAKPRRNCQLADGTTKGSKHVVVGGEVYEGDSSTLAEIIRRVTSGRIDVLPQYVGPVFSGPCVLEHPQHQHQEFPAGTCTVTVFQRNLDSEERESRARD